ncbi:sugar phosphate nucleotidyltransferase [Halalkalicoccus jeotgali]|uniref:Nucleotidyl transferase n=1 Tax=Halalkalicoccus jeotgali (strain DSM 18796 / CECT 7217 / JCM 14584 / KCTC 4019 / B3) TaxID=795797 RepID=D8J6W5_HALJB|nr:NDP-sugar synthase [Halalkalicoccus jeotgali]ADJ15918.1 Nucleotidyl transferase [Halalkalicoccus jeotgali B3]ELY38014.1 Nucleotidyl transferase [Halalkalicoccus jeotgali B3]
MDAIVLAGGYATRLWPITKHRPKMFLPVGGETVIDQVFAGLEADERIEDVYVSTNERFAEDFEEHIAASRFEKPRVSVEDTSAEDEKFGVVGALAQLIEREGLAEDTLVIAGDNLISFDVSDFIDFFERKDAPVLAAYDVGSYERASQYGIVDIEGDRVVGFQEKPDEPESTLASIACYGFPARTLPQLGEYLEDGNNPDEPGWFIQWLVDQGEVYAFTFDEAWYDIGTPESYLEAVSWFLDGDSHVHPDATVEDCEIGENVHIMAGAHLEGVTAVNSVVFPDVTARNCELRGTIIDEGTHVEEINLAGALIGAHTRINGEEQ